MTNSDKRIYLASRSPRRRELLQQIGIAFEVLTPGDAVVDETPRAGEAPVAYAMRAARAKAEMGWRRIVMQSLHPCPVLAADTAIALDGDIVGKPDSAEHACELLRRLSGRTHQVLSAIAVVRKQQLETALSTSAVEFRELDDAEIRRYVASGEPLDKAGAYAIQGRAALFVRAIEGSYSGIMGLPLFETAELLRRFDLTLI